MDFILKHSQIDIDWGKGGIRQSEKEIKFGNQILIHYTRLKIISTGNRSLIEAIILLACDAGKKWKNDKLKQV